MLRSWSRMSSDTAGSPARTRIGPFRGFEALRSDLIDPTIAVHHGRVVKRTGDGAPRRVPQRGGRRALRDRGAKRHGRAQRRRAARPPYRLSDRDSSRRRRRGERRRPDGRRRQYRRAAGGIASRAGICRLRHRPMAGRDKAEHEIIDLGEQSSSRTSPIRARLSRVMEAWRQRTADLSKLGEV